MIDIEQTLAQWANVNETIDKVGAVKSTMSPTKYRELMDRLYQRKRELRAVLRSMTPVHKDNLRVAARYAI